MKPWVLLIAAIASSTIFAGCFGGGDGDKNGTGDGDGTKPVNPSYSDETGAIVGTVVDESGLGIVGAEAGIPGHADLDTRKTNSNGQFEFSDLQPGDYAIHVQKIGYSSAHRTITVVAGQAQEVEFKLNTLEPVEPFADLYPEQAGKVFFSAGWRIEGCPGEPTLGVSCNAVGLNHPTEDGYVSEHVFMVNESKDLPIQTIVAELKWPTQSAACTSDFLFDLLAPGVQRDEFGGVAKNDPKQFVGTVHTSPITIRVDREQLIQRGLVDDKNQTSKLPGDWTTRVFAHSSGTTDMTSDAGCSAEQPFTVYLTVFHGDPAEETFTRTADA